MPQRNRSDGLPVGIDHINNSAPKTVADINSQDRIANVFVFHIYDFCVFLFPCRWTSTAVNSPVEAHIFYSHISIQQDLICLLCD